jgi:hypothetical protein
LLSQKIPSGLTGNPLKRFLPLRGACKFKARW